MAAGSGTLRKYWQPILVLLAIAVVLWLIWISLAVLIPFLIGILLAYLLMPLVKWLEKVLPPRGRVPRTRRILAVVIVFLVTLTLLALFIVYIGSALGAASSVLVGKAPEFIRQSAMQFNTWLKSFQGKLPSDVAGNLEAFMGSLGPAAGKFMQDFIVGSMAFIPATLPTVLGFFALPFFLFFILVDYEAFARFFNDMLPPRAAKRTNDIIALIGEVMGRYIRSTLLLSLLAGLLVFIGLLALNIQHAAALAVVTALTQFIPIVGPVIAGLAVLVITAALQPGMVVWALLAYIVAEIILNSIFVNLVQGKYMKIHPAVIMVLLVVGGYVAGFWGMILSLPLTATVWEIVKYVRNEQPAEKPGL